MRKYHCHSGVSTDDRMIDTPRSQPYAEKAAETKLHSQECLCLLGETLTCARHDRGLRMTVWMGGRY